MSPTPEEATAACRLLDDLTRTASDVAYRFEHIESLPATEAILGADQRTQMAIIREGIERLAQMRDRLGKPQGLDVRYMNLLHEQGYPKFPLLVATRLLRRKLPWESDDLAYLVNRTADLGMVSIFCEPFLPVLVNLVGRHAKSHPMPADLRRGLVRLRQAAQWKQYRAGEGRLCKQLAALTDTAASKSVVEAAPPTEPGDATEPPCE